MRKALLPISISACTALWFPARAQINDTLNGVVFDSASQSNLAAVAVSSEGISTLTKTDGAFRLILPLTTSLRRSEAPAFQSGSEESIRPGFTRADGREARAAADRSNRRMASGVYYEDPGLDRSSGSRAYRAMPKTAASTNPHQLTFSKDGYVETTLTAPAGTSSNHLLRVGMAHGWNPPTALDSVAVPGGGGTVMTRVGLDKGELFLLKASGTTTGANPIDAEFGDFAAGQAGKDSVGGMDVGIDVGLKQFRALKGVTYPGRMKWFGAYRTDHVYYMLVTGTGAPLSLRLNASPAGGGSSNVTVSVFRLSPSPALSGALDSLKAPVTKVTVHSNLITDKTTVYLLQSGGAPKVGGANLGLGDADYMDWDVNGAGAMDIGDFNIDYGLGVDESDPAVTPRKYWWGPWRKDHVYYMLFQGTGMSIGFTYYDSGYGDNSTTDKLAVRIFAVP